MWSAPLAGATFTYYQVLKSETTAASSSSGNGGSSSGSNGINISLKTVLGGPAVLGLSVGLRTPFDIIEQQLQLAAAQKGAMAGDGSAAAQNMAGVTGDVNRAARPPLHRPFTPTPDVMWQRLLATWRAEGARGVWRGYPAALGGIASYVAGYFVIYETARREMERRALFSNHPTITHLLAGGLGGGLTAAFATPFDTVKVRMQTKVYVTATEPFPSMLHVWRSTVRDAGWRGLWRGATARFVSNAPSGAIMFAVYEATTRWLESKLESE